MGTEECKRKRTRKIKIKIKKERKREILARDQTNDTIRHRRVRAWRDIPTISVASSLLILKLVVRFEAGRFICCC